MKKKFLLLLVALMFAFPGLVSASEVGATIDGVPVAFEGQPPTIVAGRTLVPVRGVFEHLGFEVDWDGPNQTAILTSATHEVRIIIDSAAFTTNGTEHTLDVPAQIIGGRTMVPIRLPLESVGYYVDWDGVARTVIISSTPIVAPEPSPVPSPVPSPEPLPPPPAPEPEPEELLGEVPTGAIHVITRESGSGTRDAFVEVTGVLYDGTDRTWDEAIVESGTGAVITAVAGNPVSMGYISLGAMRDDVRALSVDGTAPSVATIVDGSYPLFRSFYLAVPENVSPLAQDFIGFIMSAEGQEIVTGRGYVSPVTAPEPFDGGGLSGSLEIEGSTSVVPLMALIADAYFEITGVRIDVHSTGSGAGITAAREGRVDIGLSSRAIRDSELEDLSDSITMAHDGIAVIVHPTNGLRSATVDEIREIFMGELTRWENIG